MATATLPLPLFAPASGWIFEGAWQTADQAIIEQTLRERILNPARALDDHWVFLVHAASYYAHSSVFHRPNIGFVATTVGDLAELLWDHYFSLHLGPLAWSPPVDAASPVPPQSMHVEDVPSPVDPLVADLQREWQALEHFDTAHALLADGDYVAAKLELELSLRLYPATTFYDHKRVETLGDIESSLGNDTAALHQYQKALNLMREWKESWTHTELRLKLSWVLLRLGQIDDARELVETALAICQNDAQDTTHRRGLNYATALALATLADIHFRQHDSDTAILRARQAAAIATRLGQAYAEKVRLLTYLAWQLYRHDETTEARTFARRAQAALERWMPLDARYIRSLRSTLTTILGSSAQRNTPSQPVILPSHEACIEEALAAARAMQNWLRQLLALHALAPYLTPSQLTVPHTDIHVWGNDFSHEEAYQILLAADLAHALPENTVSAAAQRLITIDPRAFRYLGHEWLFAESLLQIKSHGDDAERGQIEHAIATCALRWCNFVQERLVDDVRVDVLSGLAVLLPQLSADVCKSASLVMEDALLAQLQPQNSLYPTAFLTCLPVLARCGAGQRVVDGVVERDRQSVRLWIACLAHMEDEDWRESVVETALGSLETWLKYGSTTDVAELLCSLAPYVRGEQARRALALATSVRSIAPRVRALTAIARAMPEDECRIVYDIAWKAAQRSTNADVRGKAFTALAVSMASPKFGHTASDESQNDDPLIV